jgi:glycosyltransferase involved in cell wall biosynthesis
MQKELLLNCPHNVSTSYGTVSRYLLKELSKKWKTVLFPIGGLDGYSEDATLVKASRDNQANYDPESPGVRIFHQNLLAENPSKTFRIGFPIFELSIFSPIELGHLRAQDALFVCSKWAKQVIENNNINVPTKVIPLGSDPDIFNPFVIPAIPSDNKYRFLSVGKIEKRKGHVFLPKVFRQTFKNNEDVELWMMWHNHFMKKEEIKEWEDYYKSILGNQVRFLPWVNHPKEVASLMASADCLVNPSLAEGFGLPILDMMFLDKPVITTNYSAMPDYCKEYLVNVDKTELAVDGKWFDGQNGGEWAHYGKDQFEQLSIHMRNVFETRPKTDNLELRNNWTWVKSASRMTSSIERLF